MPLATQSFSILSKRTSGIATSKCTYVGPSSQLNRRWHISLIDEGYRISKIQMASTAADSKNKNSTTAYEIVDIENDDNDVIEGFGVGEKTIELRDLVESVNDVDIDAPPEDQISKPKKVKATKKRGKSATPDTSPKETSTESHHEEPQSQRAVPTLRPMSVLRFVAPTLALWIAPPVMSLIDTSVVGRYCGPTDLAALNPGCTLIDSSSYLFFFIATAATNMVASSRADGKSSSKAGATTAAESEQQRIIGEALFLAMMSGIFLASLVFFAGQPLLSGIAGKQSADVVPSALKYATVRAYGQPFVVMASVARAAALAQKDTTGPLLSVALAFVLNAIGTTTLVRFTPLGIVGAALATLGADVAATIYLLWRIRRKRRSAVEQSTNNGSVGDVKSEEKEVAPLFVIPTKKNFKKFLQYAAPIFFTILGKTVIYNGVAISIGRLGAVALAAHQVLLRSFFFWTPVGDSVGMTSQVFLPGILAEERKSGIPKHGARRLLFTTGVVAGLVAAALAGLLPSKGAGLFTTDAAVSAALRETSPILALSVSMHAIALTCEGMLLAQRDLSFLSTSYVITTILTAALLLSPFRPATLAGSWWILAMFQGGRAVQFALRTLSISRRRREKLQAA